MKPKIIICDIDGTIADITHRLHYIKDTFAVGDIVHPANIPFAKSHKGTVDFIKDNLIGIIWDNPFPPNAKQSEVYDNTTWCWPLRKAKSWNKFFGAVSKDEPILSTINMLEVLGKTYSIVFCSGRPEKYREDTFLWLAKHGIIPNLRGVTRLFMRQDNDYRPDYIVKEEILHEKILPNYDPVLVLDDRKQVVDMWRRNGLTCWQVAEGNF